MIALAPLVWMAETSLKSNREITQDGTLYPHGPTLANYRSLFSGRQFGSYLTNSIGITALSVLISLVLGSLAAYAIARYRLRCNLERHIGVGLLTLRILPPIVIIVPAFLIVERFGLLNTWLGLIVIYSAFNVSFVVWMMESFFREIPVDLEEAAMVDGDSRFTAFRRIVLPLARPGLAATAIFAVIVTYNEFLFALVLTSTPDCRDDARRRGDADRPHQRRLGRHERGGHRRRGADRSIRAHRATPSGARSDDGGGQVKVAAAHGRAGARAVPAVQSVERDGEENPFFAGAFGIFGHGNLAGIGQAIHQEGLRFVPARNEQAMVHAAIAYARARRRLGAWACTSSVGPGATNMLTGAALATINRLPVLLLPGDIFATRRVDPVLQQLEAGWSRDVSVNDAFRPVSRYWDRINRPEQLGSALLEAMRVLTDPAETGAVTLCLPQDVQAEATTSRSSCFEPRVWHVGRPHPDARAFGRALGAIRAARAPLIVAGGGVHHADATDALPRLRRADRHPRRRDAGRQGRAAATGIRSRSARSAPPARAPPT